MKNFLLFIMCLATTFFSTAQPGSVGIGTTTPDSSARLEVAATNKGMLIPRMTTAQRSSIAKPATGLLVYQINASAGFYYYNGLNWFSLTNGVAIDTSGMVSPLGNALVATLAGSGSSAYADGMGTAASFSYPAGVAVDVAGNVYVADFNNHRIRKVTSTGVVTTLAGSGNATYTDGTGTAASFSVPAGLAVDVAGNVYVADRSDNRIRKISPGGVVTTLAGSGNATYTDGIGTAASFRNPTGVAADVAGNVYVADQNNNRIRKITPGGNVSTLAGSGNATYTDGIGTAASFNSPTGVAVDVAGNVYVADQNNNRIRKITPGGDVSTLAGSSSLGNANGMGTAASFNHPTGVAMDVAGNVYVADQNNNRIRKITPAGLVTTLAGGGSDGYADGTGTAASFNGPSGVAVDVAGNVYVADQFHHRIRTVFQSNSIYATTASLNSYVNTNAVQTVSGAKTFTAPTTINAGGSDAFTILNGGDTRLFDDAGTSSVLLYTSASIGTAGANKGVFTVLSDGKTYTFTGTGGSVSSDERLKQDIQPIRGSLAKLQQLHGYSYRYKSKADAPTKEVGVLAQEVKKVLPEAVYTGADSMYSVSYNALVPLLINAVKEQQVLIEKSRKEAAAAKAINENLLHRLEAVEDAIKGQVYKKNSIK